MRRSLRSTYPESILIKRVPLARLIYKQNDLRTPRHISACTCCTAPETQPIVIIIVIIRVII